MPSIRMMNGCILEDYKYLCNMRRTKFCILVAGHVPATPDYFIIIIRSKKISEQDAKFLLIRGIRFLSQFRRRWCNLSFIFCLNLFFRALLNAWFCLFFGSTTLRTYIDPHTYEDPKQAVKEFALNETESHTDEPNYNFTELNELFRAKYLSTGVGE